MSELINLVRIIDSVLGMDLLISPANNIELIDIPPQVQMLIDQRQEARSSRDWAESDRLRDEIVLLGYCVKDSEHGYEIIKSAIPPTS